MESFGDSLGLFPVCGILDGGVHCLPDGGGGSLFQRNTGAQLLDSDRNAALLFCFRQHYQRYTEIQAFAGAIHAAMGQEDVCFLQHGDLIHMRFITEQAWSAGSALSIVLLVFVLISMAIMRRAERAGGQEPSGGGGRLW